jgi:hypothetical protein
MTSISPVCGRVRTSEGAVAYKVGMSDPVRDYLRTLAGLTRAGRLKLHSILISCAITVTGYVPSLLGAWHRARLTSAWTTSFSMGGGSGGWTALPTIRQPSTAYLLWCTSTASLDRDGPLDSKQATASEEPGDCASCSVEAWARRGSHPGVSRAHLRETPEPGEVVLAAHRLTVYSRTHLKFLPATGPEKQAMPP